jgi:large subunit ribosomal protein L14e
MATLEIGRVVMKTAGREAGKYAVVLKKVDNAFVLISGPKLLTGVKRRRCNINQLQPLQHILEIKEEAADEDIVSALEKAGLVTELGLNRPSAAEMKAEKAKPAKEEKKEKPKKEEKQKEEKPKKEDKKEKKK